MEFFHLDSLGRCTGNGPLGRDPHGLSRQERRRDVLDAPGVFDDEALFPGPLVDGEDVVHVGGGRDDRCGADAFRDGPGEVVRAAQVAGEDGDGVGAALVDHDDGGVGHLALHEGRDGPHRDAGGADEHEGVGLVEHLGGPLREAEGLVAPGHGHREPGRPVRQLRRTFRESGMDAFRQGVASGCEREDVDLQDWVSPFAGRKPVAKVGS